MKKKTYCDKIMVVPAMSLDISGYLLSDRLPYNPYHLLYIITNMKFSHYILVPQ